MITYKEALQEFIAAAKPKKETETIPTLYAEGRILAEDVVSTICVPPWDNSQMDGYALRELVSAIYVDAPDKSSGKRVQHIHIKYDGLGFIPLNELMKKETA